MPIAAHPFHAIPSLPVSYRVASPPCRFYSHRFRSQLYGSTLRHLSSGHVRAFPLRILSNRVPASPPPCASSRVHSLPCQFVPSRLPSSPWLCESWPSYAIPLPVNASVAAPFMAIPLRSLGLRFVSIPLQRILHLALLIRFFAPRIASMRRRFSSCRSNPGPASPCQLIAYLRYAVSHPCISLHLLFESSALRSAPSRFAALHFFSKQGRSIAVHGVVPRIASTPCLFRSDPFASAGRVSKSARYSSCPSFAMPCHLGSTRIDSTPSLLFSRLVASWQRGSVSPLLSSEQVQANPCPLSSSQIRAVHLRRESNRVCSRQSLVGSAPPAPISAVPDRCASLPLNSALRRFLATPRPSCRGASEPFLLGTNHVAAALFSSFLIRFGSSTRQSARLPSVTFRFVGIRRAAFPFHFAVTQDCALPWQCHSHWCRFVASPIDSNLCCAAPSPRCSRLV